MFVWFHLVCLFCLLVCWYHWLFVFCLLVSFGLFACFVLFFLFSVLIFFFIWVCFVVVWFWFVVLFGIFFFLLWYFFGYLFCFMRLKKSPFFLNILIIVHLVCKLSLGVSHSCFLKLKPGIHYVIFAPIFPWFYSLNKLTLVEESQSQFADYSWQIPQKIT